MSGQVVLNVIYEWMTKNAAEYGPEVLVKDGGKKVRGEDLLRLVRWTQLQVILCLSLLTLSWVLETDFLASFGYWNKPRHLKYALVLPRGVNSNLRQGLPADGNARV